MQQRTVSTMQPLTGQTPGAANKLLLTRMGLPVLQRVQGYMAGADSTTQLWLMFFAGTSVPVDTTKPLYELQVTQKTAFDSDYGAQGGLDFSKMVDLPVGTQGLIVQVSSTSGALTASVVTADIQITFNDAIVPSFGQSVAGDLTSAVALLAVFTNPQTVRKAIYRLDATNTDGGAIQYLGIYQTAPSANQIPLAVFPVANAASITQFFGTDGFAPFQQTAAVPPVAQNGCYLYVSTDATKYVAPSGTHWTIRAFYK